MKNRKLLVALAAVFFVIWGAAAKLSTNYFITHLLLMISVYSLLACSLNIVVGITGQANMAQAAFFGIGAYVTAILSTRYNFPFLLNFILGGFVAMLFGLLIGMPTLKLKGFYFSLVTIAFGSAIQIIENNLTALTGGPMGITGIRAIRIFGYKFSKGDYVILALVLLAVLLFFTHRLLISKTGRALQAIRSDEVVAKSLGVNTALYKVLAFAISSFFAGMAGTIYAHYIAFVSPDTFTSDSSIQAVCMVILGGSGTLFGPILGAIVLLVAPEVLRFTDNYRIIFVGVVMILGVMFRELHYADRFKAWLKSKCGKNRMRRCTKDGVA